MNNLHRALLIPWVLPIAVLMWLFYLLPLWALGRVVKCGYVSPMVIRFVVVMDGGWYSRRWQGWAGFALPFAIIVKPNPTPKTERHELRHTDQWLVLGPLYPVVYGLLLLFTGYRANPFEQDARSKER